MQPILNTPDEILAWIWRSLSSAVNDASHPYRLPAVATMSPPEGPAVRTVVLRAVNAEQRTLEFHTDRRSAKVAELQAEDRLAWHFWDPVRQIQLRMRSRASLHVADVIAEARWATCPASKRLAYARETPPGAVLAEMQWIDAAAEGTDEAVERGWTNFAVVIGVVEQIDFYEIRGTSQRRASFTREGNEWIGRGRSP